MNRRLKKMFMMLVLVISLTAIAGQSVSAGVPVRCGAACYSGSFVTPYTPDS